MHLIVGTAIGSRRLRDDRALPTGGKAVMPLFHFHIVEGDEREHVGSMELPSRGEALPAGLEMTLKILANSARLHGADERLSIQATDAVGAVVYNFDITSHQKGDDRPRGYRH